MSIYGYRDIVIADLIDLSTNKPVLRIDYLKTASQAYTNETVYAKAGRGAPKRVGFQSGNAMRMDITAGLLNPELLAILFGTDVSVGQQYVYTSQVLTVTGTSGTLDASPYQGDLTTYPITVYTTDDGSTMDTELTSGATPTTGEYSISGSTITFGDTYTADKIFVSYYKATSVTNKRVKFQADKYTKAYKLVGSTLWKSEADQLQYPCTITIPKLQIEISGTTLNSVMEGDPTELKFAGEALRTSDSQDLIILDIDEGATGI